MSVLNKFRLIWKIRPLENILVWLTKGKEYGKLVTKFPPNHYQYKVGSIRTVERDGIRYQLDLADLVDWYIYFGFIEPARMNLYNLVKPGSIVMDVGANVGDTTMHLAKYAGEKGQVHSFEPDTYNFARITKNLSLNNFKNITLNNLGLGAEESYLKIIVRDEHNRGMNQLIKEELKEGDAGVKIVKLDDYISENAIDHVDLIKIDVEGFDFEVLKGASQILDRIKPDLFIELDDRCLKKQASSAMELVAFLNTKGYEVKHAETAEKITSEMDFENCHFDIIGKA